MKKGFTLIELIIVIIIVGILASVGITQYTKVIEKGRAAEARMVLGALRTAEVAEKNENGSYVTYNAANADSLGVSAPTACGTTAATKTHYFSYACTDAGLCTATRCLGTNGKQPGFSGTTAYTKTLDADTGVWGGTGGY